jgi:hypothetical protein
MSRNDVPEYGKKRLTREWRGNCWKRLDADIRAMDTRMERVKAEIGHVHGADDESAFLYRNM